MLLSLYVWFQQQRVCVCVMDRSLPFLKKQVSWGQEAERYVAWSLQNVANNWVLVGDEPTSSTVGTSLSDVWAQTGLPVSSTPPFPHRVRWRSSPGHSDAGPNVRVKPLEKDKGTVASICGLQAATSPPPHIPSD